MVQRFLPKSEVIRLTGLPQSTLYEKIAAGEFPKPVPLTPRRVGWLEDEIDEWQKSRIEARDRVTLGKAGA